MNVVSLTSELVAFPSVSERSNVPAAEFVRERLLELGCRVERVPYVDENGVKKLCVLGKLGEGRGGLSLLSHVDVVPVDGQVWTGDPFKTRIVCGRLIGRGACDMKGPLASTICAAHHFKKRQFKKPLFIMVTADEELRAGGAREVVARARLFKEAQSGMGIICEPTGLRVVNAHKGVLMIVVTSKGKAAHTSTLKGINANVKMIPFLAEMRRIYDLVLTAKKYRNDMFDPPVSEWSLCISDHNTAINVSPLQSVCRISYRLMPGVDVGGLIERTLACARKQGLQCDISKIGDAVLTPLDAPVVSLAKAVTGTRKVSTVPYGTDGMAYVEKMKNLVVLGPGSIAQAHTADEWISLDQLHRSVEIYSELIRRVCM